MKHRNRLIIYLILGIFVISGMLLVSYGYMGSDVSGNETAKEFVNLSQILKVKYSGGTENLTTKEDGYFAPGSVLTKTFSIKNTGNVNINYGVKLSEVVNDFERVEDLVYELYLEDTLLITDNFPNYDKVLAYSQTINVGETKNYTLKVIYKESLENQIVDQNKVINAKINFIQTKNTLSNIKILGNSVQDGTPTPTSSREIESVGDLINTLDIYEERIAIKGKLQNDNYKVENGIISFKTSYYTIASHKFGIKFEVEPNTDYILSYTTLTGRSNNVIYDLNGNQIATNNLTNLKFNSGNNTYLVLQMRSNSWDLYTEIMDVMIRKSSVTSTQYEPFGYKIPVSLESKNLVHINSLKKFDRQSDGSYLSNKNITTSDNVITDLKGIYTVSVKIKCPVGKNYRLNVKYIDGTTDNNYKASTGEYVNFVFTTNGKDIETIYWSYSSQSNEVQFKDLQIEEGNTATQFEPFKETINVYLNEPLRKIGNFVDTIDFKTNKIERNIGKRLFTGTTEEVWYRQNYRVYIYTNALSTIDANQKGILSNYFNGNTWQNLWYNSQKTEGNFLIGTALQESGVVNVTPSQTVPTVSEWKTQLQEWYNNGKPFTVWYAISPSLTDMELPNIYSINPDAEITIDTTVPATIVKE